MKLSFVIPAHNEEAFIGNCLESIEKACKGRSYDVEIIVVNNASGDRTREVAQKFKSVRIVDEPRKGLTFARAAGFHASTGDLIANVDADNMINSRWVDFVLEEFGKDSELVAISGPLVYHDLSYTTRVFVRIFYLFAFVVYISNRFVFRVGSMIQGGNFVVRRSAIQKIGGFDTSITFYGEDADLARRLHTVGKVKFTFYLPIDSSGRRLAKEGVIWPAILYSINYFWVIFFKKPITTQSTDIRPSQKDPRKN